MQKVVIPARGDHAAHFHKQPFGFAPGPAQHGQAHAQKHGAEHGAQLIVAGGLQPGLVAEDFRPGEIAPVVQHFPFHNQIAAGRVVLG